jgi:hypothetical protein
MHFCAAKIIESRRDRRHNQEFAKQIRPTATKEQTAQRQMHFCAAKIIESRKDRRHNQEFAKQIRPTATNDQTAQRQMHFCAAKIIESARVINASARCSQSSGHAL